ncbi:F-box protein At2g35280-like [Rutidosis leptorrhynchoides]|uniref:F-box protein At2g35280-like n=1 Tax=Rutidosis leptorrhynchoides TaxID=125765 RepID=UPI003A99C218
MDVMHIAKKQKIDVAVRQQNILDLSQDTLMEILFRVGQDSSDRLFLCKLVCKAFKKHSEDPSVYKRISFDRWPISPWDNPKLVRIFLRCYLLGNPNAIFRYGFRGYFNGKYINIGLRFLEKASNMQLKEACYVYGLVMFAFHQIEEKNIGLQILNQTFPPWSVPNLLVATRIKVFDMFDALMWRLNRHPFNDLATCCLINGHNGYSPKFGWEIEWTVPECMSCFWSFELRFLARRHLYL